MRAGLTVLQQEVCLTQVVYCRSTNLPVQAIRCQSPGSKRKRRHGGMVAAHSEAAAEDSQPGTIQWASKSTVAGKDKHALSQDDILLAAETGVIGALPWDLMPEARALFRGSSAAS